MRAVPAWVDRVHDRDRNEQCIYDLCFRPDGSQLVVAAGQRVLVYDTSDGSLIQPLKGHKDNVYCVDYAKDGRRFASGGADKYVIIWTSKLEGILKYSHNDSVLCLAYNPVSHQLASCAHSDFGLWSAEQKSVQKHKVPSRVNCCSWTEDGQFIALGLGSGVISIRSKSGEERTKIERPSSIWSLAFSPPQSVTNQGDSACGTNEEVLCVADWSQAMSFYTVQGRPVGKERHLAFDPCCVAYFPKGEYLLVAGSNRSCVLYTKDGVRLGEVGDQQGSWVWCCAARPNSSYVAMGCQDGTIAYYQLVFSTVHGLYRERYAFREHMTDVIIQHLLTDQKVRIKCRDLVKKISIYKHRLAVQLPERIVIYELYSNSSGGAAAANGHLQGGAGGGGSTSQKGTSAAVAHQGHGLGGEGMHYRVKDKINQKIDCNLLVVCTNHLVLCQERKLQCLNFQGLKEREWVMESLIRYIKVVGGPPEREGLLLGLKNGKVLKIFLDNPFPVHLLTIGNAVRCLDLSPSRQKLAVVDENSTCLVYDLTVKKLVYQEPNANSVAWNTQCEDLICYSGGNVLSIKAGDFPAHQQKMMGFVVGFSGPKIFCLHVYNMTTLEVPLSSPMYQYLENNDLHKAYQVACLGVTEGDWECLGETALEALDFEVARRAYTRLRDLRKLELISELEVTSKNMPAAATSRRHSRQEVEGEDPQVLLLKADINAFQGKFAEAAKLYKKAGQDQRALTMYTDLRMFDLANEFLTDSRGNSSAASAGGGDSAERRQLIRMKADWAAKINEPRAAAEMYLSAGEEAKAIRIMGEHGWVDMLTDVGRKLDKADTEALSMVASYLKQLGQLQYAREMYRKVGDLRAVVDLYVEAKEWEEAFSLARKYPEFKQEVFVPYAEWLAESDRFAEAQKAFHQAGRPDEAFRVLNELTLNAVNESRFDDASYYYWVLSAQYADLEGLEESTEAKAKAHDKFLEFQRMASIYYAYHTVQRYTDEPFTSHMPEALFNISRYLMHELMTGQDDDVGLGMQRVRPKGVSEFSVLYTLAKQARNLGAYKLARQVLDKVQGLVIPRRFRDNVDLATLMIRAKPFSDNEELLTICYRCSTTNPLVNSGRKVIRSGSGISSSNNRCTNCNQPFVFSFVSFEILPLVEFTLEKGISDKEAVGLIESSGQRQPQDQPDGGFDDHGDDDPFNFATNSSRTISSHQDEDDVEDVSGKGLLLASNPASFRPIVVNRRQLSNMVPGEVIVARWPEPLRYQFFRNLMPDMSVTKCDSCHKMFHTDDFELQLLQKGHCPFCRTAPAHFKAHQDLLDSSGLSAATFGAE